MHLPRVAAGAPPPAFDSPWEANSYANQKRGPKPGCVRLSLRGSCFILLDFIEIFSTTGPLDKCVMQLGEMLLRASAY